MSSLVSRLHSYAVTDSRHNSRKSERGSSVAKISSYLLVLCLVLSMSAAFGQVNSSVTGTVTDSTGAVIPNASLELKNSETGAVFASGTSATGNYTIAVPPGTYELTVTQKGFKKSVQKNLIVGTATAVRQDFQLAIGEATEIVTVTESAPLLKTESADISHTVTSDRVDNLPVLTLSANNIRNPLQVVNLLPGASFNQNGAVGSQMVRINGLPSNTQAIRIEGQDATNGIWKEQTQIAQSGIDAIQEVAIQTSNFAAEYGQAGGGYFNFTMKSGTNQFHGSAYSYIVNEFMNAGTPNTNAGTTNGAKCYAGGLNSIGVPTCFNGEHTKNRLRQLDYGFTVGGPIKIPKIYDGHDKTFFFFNFEQYRRATTTSNTVQTVPTLGYRNGDFSAAGLFNGNPQLITWVNCAKNASGQCIGADGNPLFRNELYDPLTTVPGPDGNLYRTAFAPFNVIPKTRLDPVAVAVQNMLPLPLGPNATSLARNYNVPAYNSYKHTTNPSIKIDHSLSSTVKISGYASETHTQSPNNNGFLGQPFNSSGPQDDVSRTIRVNYDQTVTPTLLLHFGAGYLWTYNPTIFPTYDPSQAPPAGIGLVGFQANIFPAFAGLSDGGLFAPPVQGGTDIGLGAGGGFPRLMWEEKPTGNANLTWIKNNHTFKLGLDLTLDGFVHRSPGYSNGNLNFSADTTGLPAQVNAPIATGRSSTTGFAYASFMLGQVTSESVSGTWAARIGNRAIGMYLQDTWKVTRKLTLDYGLRYDYQTYLKETYGRLINVSFSTPNPTVGNRNGAVIFEGNGPGKCNCTYGSNYPYAIGPRIGVAYQIDSKTVLRVGGGIAYCTTAENAQLSYNIGQAVSAAQPGGTNSGTTAWPVVNAAGNELVGGNIFRVGNPYGNAPVVWPNFDPGQYPTKTFLSNGTPQFIPSGGPLTGNFDRNMGRPSRIISWSFGLQREVRRDLVVEAAYVGNRGAWFTAPALQDINQNAYTAQDLMSKYGLDITKSTVDAAGVTHYPDQDLLTGNLTSQTAINRGFATPAYPGMPLTQSVGQQLRPYPQFTAVNPFLGPPLGDTWYDSLQPKVTKRYSHGLEMQTAFTWQKEESLGTNSSTSYFTPGALAINDIFNRNQNKSISSLSQPFQLVISGSYTTPKTKGDGMMLKALSVAVRDWQLGTVLRYQSGAIKQDPQSNNNLFAVLQRTNGFYALNTPVNRIAGVPLYAGLPDGGTDPNCKCFDPNKQLLTNPAAFQNPLPGQFGASSSFFNDYRWMRQPSEALSFARNFRMGKEGKYNLQVRGEFQNVFNRRFYSAPTGGSVVTPTTFNTTAGSQAFGSVTGGLGYVNATNGLGAVPRSGQGVIRFIF